MEELLFLALRYGFPRRVGSLAVLARRRRTAPSRGDGPRHRRDQGWRTCSICGAFLKGLPQSYLTTASGAALPGSLARSFRFLASLKITAPSLARRRRTPTLMRTGFLPGGTSFAGMYIVELAASDTRLAGAIVDGFAAARMASPARGLRVCTEKFIRVMT
jgi:hypothetical protein